jgi:hypothetical protein
MGADHRSGAPRRSRDFVREKSWDRRLRSAADQKLGTFGESWDNEQRGAPKASRPMDATRIALIGIAVAFAAYLFVQVRPALSPRRRALYGELRAARKRAEEASSEPARASALADAAEIAARASRWVAASGLFLRALRADPQGLELVTRMAAALSPRPRLLASILERRMGGIGDGPEERPAFVVMAKALLALYEGPLRRRFHAKLIARLIAHEEAALTHAADRSEPSS